MSKPTEKSRIFYFDMLNIAACFCVILLHVNTAIFIVEDTAVWRQSLFLQTLGMWCVPVFFMLTGANLLEYREKYSTAEFFKKRLIRVFLPFIIWSGIYLVWNIYLGNIQINSFVEVVNYFTCGKIEPIFWFFYSLFPMYLSIPILSLITKKENKKLVWYLFGLAFICNAILPLLTEFAGISYMWSLTSHVGNGYVGYILLGWLLKHEEFNKRSRFVIYLLGIAAAVGMYFGSVYMNFIRYPGTTELNKTFMDYFSINCYILSAAVFLFFKHVNWGRLSRGRIGRFITVLSGASFGIYLVQMIVIYYYRAFRDINIFSLRWRTVGAVIIYFLCAAIILLIKRLPVVRKIVP